MQISRAWGWSRAAGLVAVAGLLTGGFARAEWSPPSGQWGKSNPEDLRIMTWNVKDAVRSLATKQEGFNSWTAVARIVAAFKPDVLLLQECGDNDDEGDDSVADLTATFELFFHGGTDPFVSGSPAVTAFVQAYDADYDLPHIFVSQISDGFNRNVILSRYPFADLNGDTKSFVSNIVVLADLYAPGGSGETRGFQWAEIDLADDVYCGDIVVGNCHLKAFSEGAPERLEVGQNMAYLIDYWFNGGGEGVPDPRNRIFDLPPATQILDEYTPVVAGGDLNEDELFNGRRGPADWLAQAAQLGGTDGTDRDRGDMLYDDARDIFTGGRGTFGSNNKLDYLIWQDSIAGLRREFLWRSNTGPSDALPPEVEGFGAPTSISGWASDHVPVIIDLVLPTLANGDCDACADYTAGDANGDGTVNGFDIDPFVQALTDPAGYVAEYGETALFCRLDINGDGAVNGFDIDPFVLLLTGG